jgi:endonuclease III related protein
MPFEAVRQPAERAETLLARYYHTLLSRLGPQGWWPARTRFEVILGAILTQNTSWKNVELAMARLRNSGLLRLSRLKKASRSELEWCVHPSGFFRQKASTIQNFLAWLDGTCAGSLPAMFTRPPAQLRRELLQIRGLGPETADAILLYAGRKAFFVADAYTRRVLARHQLVPDKASYSRVQEFLHQNLPADEALFNEYHALLVDVGKSWCRKAEPRCEECPLKEFLPAHELASAAPRVSNIEIHER